MDNIVKNASFETINAEVKKKERHHHHHKKEDKIKNANIKFEEAHHFLEVNDLK